MSSRKYCSLCGSPRPYRNRPGRGWTTIQVRCNGRCYTGYFCPSHTRESHEYFMDDWIDGSRVPWIERQDAAKSRAAKRAYQ